MPTIVWAAALFIGLGVALAAIFRLARQYLALHLRIQTCETALVQLERSERLTPTRLAELAHVNEAIASAEQLLEKVNRREIAAARKRTSDGTYVAVNGSDKDSLRRAAGLRAGQPARHQ